MPYVSTAQEHYFEGCLHNPQHMKGKCPDEKTLTEYHNATFHSVAEKRVKARRALAT